MTIPFIVGPFEPSLRQLNDLINEINAVLAEVETDLGEIDVLDASFVAGPASITPGHLATWGADNRHIVDGGAVPAGGGGAPGAILLRTDATALTSDILVSNAAANQTVYVLESATGVPITLPAATTNQTFEFISNLKPTSNGIVINCVGSDKFRSNLLNFAAADAAAYQQNATTAGNHNRMTLLNGGAGTGGEIGDRVLLKCYVAGEWHVQGLITCAAGSAVFSAF